MVSLWGNTPKGCTYNNFRWAFQDANIQISVRDFFNQNLLWYIRTYCNTPKGYIYNKFRWTLQDTNITVGFLSRTTSVKIYCNRSKFIVTHLKVIYTTNSDIIIQDNNTTSGIQSGTSSKFIVTHQNLL